VSPRPLAGSRLRRVLALVPWIAEHPGAALEAIAARFGVSEVELERDLELLPLCGLPPYTPDRLIDVEIIDGHVWIRFAEYFDRPLRLSAEEGLGLLTAGRALLAVPGSDEHGALARALEKVEIDYYSFGRNATTTRQVDLRSVFHAFGHWYAAAYCHQAEDERLFRLDRIRAVRPTGERFDPAAGDEPDFGVSVYHPRSDDPRVTLELDPGATWVVESYPAEEAEERPDGSWRVVLAVSERAWLERLLLDLGPAVRVVEPAGLQTVGAEAAGRLLTRYRN
jgi:proteasome accessory factor C